MNFKRIIRLLILLVFAITLCETMLEWVYVEEDEGERSSLLMEHVEFDTIALEPSLVTLESLIKSKRSQGVSRGGEDPQRQWESIQNLLKQLRNTIDDIDKQLIELDDSYARFEQAAFETSEEKALLQQLHKQRHALRWRRSTLEQNESHYQQHLRHRVHTAPRDSTSKRNVTVTKRQVLVKPLTNETRIANETVSSFEWSIPCVPFHYADSQIEGKKNTEEAAATATIVNPEQYPKQYLQFAVVVATYQRRSYNYIGNLHTTLMRQTYPHWKIFLIGDHYENNEEFYRFAGVFPEDKILAVNLPWAGEREGTLVGADLWTSGGVNSVNTGLNLAQEESFFFVAHIDDDDSWHPEHLEELARAYMDFPDASMAYTKAFYSGVGGAPFPGTSANRCYNNVLIRPAAAIHSSVSWRSDVLVLRYLSSRELGRTAPADAAMWRFMSGGLEATNTSMVHLTKTTVAHLSEGGIGAVVDPFQ
eukprot:TRINITY_DN2306_c0_g2_i3.p1 TRINITY_DN2306_c0_g2~~TRINITY_DN2306_c0_g2_i3.p1  ORF type:complete len:504 (-),score=93.56 TRINITY_DN2306_c0_g2_i3:118-1548(-)